MLMYWSTRKPSASSAWSSMAMPVACPRPRKPSTRSARRIRRSQAATFSSVLPGDELEILFAEHPLEERVRHRLDSEGEADRLEFLFAVAAVHAGNADRDVALVVDVLVTLRLLLAGHDLLQAFENVEQDLEGRFVALLDERLPQRFELLGRNDALAGEPVEEVVVVELVLATDQPPELEEERCLLPVDGAPFGHPGQAALDLLRGQLEEGVDVVGFDQPGEDLVQPLRTPRCGCRGLRRGSSGRRGERLAFSGGPEAADLVDEADQQGVALDVTLLAQEVAQRVLAPADFVDVRDVARPRLRCR